VVGGLPPDGRAAPGGQLKCMQYELMRDINLGVLRASNKLSPDTGPIRPPQAKAACVPLGQILDAVKADRVDNPGDLWRDAEKDHRDFGVCPHCMPGEHGDGAGKLDSRRAWKRREPGEFRGGIVQRAGDVRATTWAH
jgi:hypothetical protein